MKVQTCQAKQTLQGIKLVVQSRLHSAASVPLAFLHHELLAVFCGPTHRFCICFYTWTCFLILWTFSVWSWQDGLCRKPGVKPVDSWVTCWTFKRSFNTNSKHKKINRFREQPPRLSIALQTLGYLKVQVKRRSVSIFSKIFKTLLMVVSWCMLQNCGAKLFKLECYFEGAWFERFLSFDWCFCQFLPNQISL